MSTIYHGVTDALIIAPGEQITTANSGLTTLRRTYQCAATYEATAESILVPGYAPADYPLLALQTAPVAQRVADVTVFSCIFYGVLSTDVYENPYDIVSSTAVSAKYEWFDYTAGYPNLNGPTSNTLTYLSVKNSGSFTYASPTVTRSWVIPIGQKTEPLVPSTDIWSKIPVTILEEKPPASTVPVGMTVKSGQTQPKASDILPVYDYDIKPISVSEEPFGTVKLVIMVFQRLWKGDGKRICPVYHDPAVLTDGFFGLTNLPTTTDSLLSGLSITATPGAWDSNDSLAVSAGSGPVNITVTPLDSLPDYWIQYKTTFGNDSALALPNTIAGSGNYGFPPIFPPGYQLSSSQSYQMPVTSPVTYAVYPGPTSGTISVNAVTELGDTVSSASTSLTTDGLPTPVHIVNFQKDDLMDSVHAGFSGFFDTPVSACGSTILYYGVKGDGSGESTIAPGTSPINFSFTDLNSNTAVIVTTYTDRGQIHSGKSL